MIKRKLGVNIDHVATIRNARGESYPDPLKAALIAERAGADSVTIHLREDRRHIRDSDLKKIKRKISIPLNLEMAPTLEMLKIAKKNKPNYVCLVPEKRSEITTEGGLNVKKNKRKIKKVLNKLNKSGIRTSLFINPSLDDIKLAKNLGAKCIEIHTGKISNNIKKKTNHTIEFNKIKKCAQLGSFLNLEIHAGHGMDYKTTKILSKIKEIKEFNIGHFLIGESIFDGLKHTIMKFKKIMRS